MGEVIELQTNSDLDNQAAIDELEGALQAAKDGKIESVAIITVSPKGAINACWSENSNIPPMLGGITLLQYRMMRQIEEDGQD